MGTPVGVKVQGGILDFVTRELEIECLPTDIPEKIVVDVSELELGKHIRVSDLKLPDKVTMLTEPDIVIVHVVAPRAEEEVAAAAAAAGGGGRGGAEPEVIKKGKAAAEGEAPRSEKAARRTRRPRRRRRSSRRVAPCASWWAWATRASATAGPGTTSASWWWTSWPRARARARWPRGGRRLGGGGARWAARTCCWSSRSPS